MPYLKLYYDNERFQVLANEPYHRAFYRAGKDALTYYFTLLPDCEHIGLFVRPSFDSNNWYKVLVKSPLNQWDKKPKYEGNILDLV